MPKVALGLFVGFLEVAKGSLDVCGVSLEGLDSEQPASNGGGSGAGAGSHLLLLQDLDDLLDVGQVLLQALDGLFHLLLMGVDMLKVALNLHIGELQLTQNSLEVGVLGFEGLESCLPVSAGGGARSLRLGSRFVDSRRSCF